MRFQGQLGEMSLLDIFLKKILFKFQFFFLLFSTKGLVFRRLTQTITGVILSVCVVKNCTLQVSANTFCIYLTLATSPPHPKEGVALIFKRRPAWRRIITTTYVQYDPKEHSTKNQKRRKKINACMHILVGNVQFYVHILGGEMCSLASTFWE